MRDSVESILRVFSAAAASTFIKSIERGDAPEARWRNLFKPTKRKLYIKNHKKKPVHELLYIVARYLLIEYTAITNHSINIIIIAAVIIKPRYSGTRLTPPARTSTGGGGNI